MILIFGGAYQGKLQYITQRFALTPDELYTCAEDNPSPPTGKKAVYGFENWILAALKTEKDASSVINSTIDALTDEIVVCRDISCGIVPMDPLMRAWREATGRAMARLSQKSDEVVRLFCGIPERLK